jgi:DNA invertase Pin-like site-specific DNA recombinase
MRIVSYLRVSTQKQGRSGLGLEAQRAAIEGFAATRRATVLETFTEVESGTSNARPELAKALRLTKATGATLVIAKLDRLSRNASFLLALRDSGVRFVAADIPDANELTVGIMALVAQQEREAISRRTRDALSAAKARGQRLGNPNGAAALQRAGKGNTAALRRLQEVAQEHAERIRPFLDEPALQGVTSLAAVAQALNERGILTPRGGRWHKSSVRNLLERLRAPPGGGDHLRA